MRPAHHCAEPIHAPHAHNAGLPTGGAAAAQVAFRIAHGGACAASFQFRQGTYRLGHTHQSPGALACSTVRPPSIARVKTCTGTQPPVSRLAELPASAALLQAQAYPIWRVPLCRSSPPLYFGSLVVREVSRLLQCTASYSWQPPTAIAGSTPPISQRLLTL